MEFIVANWDVILIGLFAVVGLGVGGYQFVTKPSANQKEQIKAVLLQLVIVAEAKFGSNTGRVKFSYVYGELVKHISWVKYIPMVYVEQAVEQSLDTMRNLLESNKEIKGIVENNK